MTTKDQIRAAASQGLTRAEIEAGIIRRPMTADEHTAYNAARAIWKLREIKRKAEKRPSTNAERLRKFHDKQNAIERREPEDSKRRRQLERSPEKWLKWYFPFVFSLPFSDAHKVIISSIIKTNTTGKDIVVAAPRGEGKTNIMRYLSLYLLLTGRAKFPVVGGWQHRAASEAFNTWKIAITSERLVADYPEFLAPFAETTHGNRLPRLHWAGEPKPMGADIKSTRLQIVFPDGRGALAAGSLQGDIKGLNITTVSGSSLRPDVLLLDDPQDTDRAADPIFVETVLRKIDSQWVCLAGPGTRISMMVACTIFAKNDVGESLGNRPDTEFVRVSRVTAWPKDFEKEDSQTYGLWLKWYDLYCNDGRQDAIKFYRRNKKQMTDGMKVSWRYRVDKSKGDPDAFYSAMVDYFKRGKDTFFSEYQNTPVDRRVNLYELTPQMILSHRTSIAEGVVPEDTLGLILSTDINYSYGLTYELNAFRRGGKSHVVTSGVWCGRPLPLSAKNTTQQQRQNSVLIALKNFESWIDRIGLKIDMWLIDAGGEQFETVTHFCRANRISTLNPRAIIGRAGSSYNPMTRTQFGRIHARVYQCFSRDSGRWYCFDSDFYKEQAQTSYIGDVEEIGSTSLYATAPRDYAEQICREELEGKAALETRQGTNTPYVYKWLTKPGKHDYLDCHAMTLAGAGYLGLLEDGRSAVTTEAATTTPRRNRRAVYGE